MATLDEEIKQSRQAADDIVLYDPQKRLALGEQFSDRTYSPEQTRRHAIQDVKRRLMEPGIENSNLNPRGGWNPLLQRWEPHESVEGGAKTIAYGTKLSNGGRLAALALKQGYLTDQQAAEGLEEEIPRYYDNAKRVYDKRFGEGAWDKLNFKQQSILTDYEYNVKGGVSKFGKLMDAMHAGDIDAMLRESSRKNNTNRNKSIARDIDSLRPKR